MEAQVPEFIKAGNAPDRRSYLTGVGDGAEFHKRQKFVGPQAFLLDLQRLFYSLGEITWFRKGTLEGDDEKVDYQQPIAFQVMMLEAPTLVYELKVERQAPFFVNGLLSHST